MGHYIDTYCREAAGIGDYYEEASEAIFAGPLLVGESHDKPHARAIIGDLILTGTVSRLFVEIQQIDIASRLRKEPYLGKSMEELQQDNSLKTLFTILNGFDLRFKNPLTLAMIIQAAVSNKVKIYFYDVEHASPTTNEGMLVRNRKMAEVFSHKARDLYGYGSVGLVGGDHLKEDPKGVTKNYSLQANCDGMNPVILNLLGVWT